MSQEEFAQTFSTDTDSVIKAIIEDILSPDELDTLYFRSKAFRALEVPKDVTDSFALIAGLTPGDVSDLGK